MKKSAGVLLYKWNKGKLKVFLVHPGGPFWKDKDEGVWSIPKGEVEEGENDMLEVAIRELMEETGINLINRQRKEFVYLENVKQKSGKEVFCWAIEGDWSGLLMGSSYVKIEWPLKSGKIIKFLEVDRAGFFPIEQARKKINESQRDFFERLERHFKSC